MSSPPRRSSCFSDLKLDRLLAEELPLSEQERARTHVQSCESCEQRLVELQASRDTLRQALPAWSTIAARSPGSRGERLRRLVRRALPVAAPALVACAVLLLWLGQDPSSPPSSSGTRTKGGPRLGFYVKSDRGIAPGIDSQELREGEAVRFSYQSGKDSHLVILSRDGAQQISVYHSDGDASAFAPRGQGELDGSVVLDEVIGPEQIYGFFCPQAFSVRAAIEAVQADPEAPQLEGCAVAQLHWRKVGR